MPRMLRRLAAAMFGLVICAGTVASVSAQGQTGRLLVTVLDATNAVLPGATLTVTGVDDATKAASLAPVQTSARGVATIEGLRLGRYAIKAELPGFQVATLTDVVVRAGDNRHAIVLALDKLQDSVSITQDRQVAAADPRGTTFGTALTREQVDALSDDPTELARQLAEIAGPGAVIRVDSFEGAALPPKSQIKSIHITRDGFAAENHNPNAFFVDIITQPGVGPTRGALNLRSRPGTLSGRNLLTNTKGPEHTNDFFANLGGAIIKERGSYSLFLGRTTSYDTPAMNAVLADGTSLQGLTVKAPQERWQLNGLFDYALSRDQTLRLGYFEFQANNSNLGIGNFDLPERAYSNDVWNRGVYAQEAGPIGRRMFLNTRLNVGWSDSESRAVQEAPTIRVIDAFTRGGAQVSGGRHAANVNVASDLDYIRGIHSVRTGILFQWLYYHADSDANYFGTYTFDSVAAYQAGTPTNYTQRIGNPVVEYGGPIGGIYIQDDIRVSRSLTLSPGLRYEDMIHIDNPWNLGPRFGVTWAPFKSGKTTLRGSAGIFYDYLGADNWEQTLRVNGYSEREVNIVNPTYPDPGALTTTPGNRYFFGHDRAMPRNRRLSAGIDQTLSPKARVSVLYSYVNGDRLFRGLNLNAPVNGVRPDPTFANVVQVAQDGSMRQHQLTTSVNVTLASAPLSPIAGGVTVGPLVDWHRVSFSGNYTLGSIQNNTDGTFAVPPGLLADEWGPAPNDIRHRVFVSITSQTLRNLNAVLSLTATSGAPYSIRTGTDDNGDGLFNDRPLGIGRNTESMPAQWFVSANFVYTIPLGRAPGIAPPGGIGIVPGAPGSGPQVVTAPRPVARYRLQIGVNAQNLTNRQNYSGYSGVMTSPFFEKPTTVTNPRKVDLTVGLSF